MDLSGNAFDYFIVLWAGIVTSFTPCVYPVVPITASFIAGANTKGTKSMGFFISLIYVFGLALTYCTLGVIAALTGRVFGQLQNSPFVFFSLFGVLLFFALALLDIVNIPFLKVNIRNQIKPENFASILLLGIVSGFAVAPCTVPILGTILIYVGSKKNILHAASLMFVFSYGLGASLVLVGTFSGLMSHYPKSGVWLVRIKKFCGTVLLVTSFYFLQKAIKMLILS